MATVRVNMQVGGIARVREACRSVKDVVAQLEQQASKLAAKAASDRAKIQAQLAKERIRGEAAVSKEFARLQIAEVKAAQKTAAERIKSSERIQKELIKSERETGKAARREAEQTAKAQKKAADDLASYKLRVQLNSARQAGKIASQEAAAEERAAKQRQRALSGNIKTIGGAVGRGIGGVLGGAARLGGAALALGGGFAMADVATKQMSNEAASIALSNSAFQGKPGEKRLKPGDLLAMAGRVGSATGTDRGELLQGLQDYVALSGNPKILQGPEGEKSISEFAKIAKGSGANLGDILKSAGALATQNEQLTPEEQAAMLRNVVGQGKMGAVELPDLARVAGRVAAGATQYQGDQGENQRKQLALTQIARKTAGSADDAATAVVRFSSDVARNANKNGMASRVMDKNGKLRDNADILAEYFLETKGNTVKMGEGKGNLGLGAESIKVAQAMSGTYNDAVAAAKAKGASDKDANRAGAEAVRTEVKKFEGASYSEKDVDDDFQAVMKGSAERMDAALAKISGILQDRAAPFIEKLADAFEKNGPKIEHFLNSKEFDKLLESITTVVKFIADNPFKSLGILVGANILKELASAKIGQLITDFIAKKLGGGGAPGAGGGGGGGKLGKVGYAAAAVGIGWEAGQILGGVVANSGGESFRNSETGAHTSSDSSSQLAKIKARLAKGEKLTQSDIRSLALAKNVATQELADAKVEKQRVDSSRTFSEHAVDGIQDLFGGTKGESWDQRQRAAATRVSAAETLASQVSDIEKRGGVTVEKLASGDLVNLEEVSKAITATMVTAIWKASDTPVASPDAPKRNVPQNARPPA